MAAFARACNLSGGGYITGAVIGGDGGFNGKIMSGTGGHGSLYHSCSLRYSKANLMNRALAT